ncbi:hypothetical protein AGMMS49965_02070 [Bacteroidia bacterium]|nr:hypothetical protein AGMMS49965_02070 [Bacteroidia bacterium]
MKKFAQLKNKFYLCGQNKEKIMNVCTKNRENLTKFNCQIVGGLDYFVTHTHSRRRKKYAFLFIKTSRCCLQKRWLLPVEKPNRF